MAAKHETPITPTTLPIDATTPLAALRVALPDAPQAVSPPLGRITLYPDRILVEQCGGEDTLGLARLVHPDDLATAFAGWQQVQTGLLGPDTLFVTQVGQTTYTGVWCPPGMYRAVLLRQGQVAECFALPMPGAVVVTGTNRRFVLFAAPARPQPGRAGLGVALAHFPAFNLHTNGTICTGTHQFVVDPWATMGEFFASYFAAEITGRGRSLAYPDDLLARWRTLDGVATYPYDDLVPAGLTVGGLLTWLGQGMVGVFPAVAEAVAGTIDADDDVDDEDNGGWDDAGEDEE